MTRARHTSKIVLTGPSGTGKTALIAELSRLGFATLPEDTTLLYRRLFSGDRDRAKAWRDEFPAMFVDALCAIRLELDDFLPPDNASVAFFDRGAPDLIAYCERRNLLLSDEMRAHLMATAYDRIFLFPPSADFEYRPQKCSRDRTAHDVAEHYRQLKSLYASTGAVVEEMPPCSNAAERLESMLQRLGLARAHRVALV